MPQLARPSRSSGDAAGIGILPAAAVVGVGTVWLAVLARRPTVAPAAGSSPAPSTPSSSSIPASSSIPVSVPASSSPTSSTPPPPRLCDDIVSGVIAGPVTLDNPSPTMSIRVPQPGGLLWFAAQDAGGNSEVWARVTAGDGTPLFAGTLDQLPDYLTGADVNPIYFNFFVQSPILQAYGISYSVRWCDPSACGC